jgi:predicted DNA-binding WGR domain protein
MVTMTNIDPTKNKWRFYNVQIGRTLFGDGSLTREHGRLGPPGRTTIESFASEEETRRAEGETIRLRIRDGYSQVSA